MPPNSKVRRIHSAQLKAAVLAACNEPGASIAAVALAHGLNANLVRKWLMGRGLQRAGLAPSAPHATTSAPPAPPLPVANARFLPIEMEAAPPPSAPPTLPAGAGAQPEPTLHIELKRGPVSLTVHWPASAAADCAAWLRELTGGLLK